MQVKGAQVLGGTNLAPRWREGWRGFGARASGQTTSVTEVPGSCLSRRNEFPDVLSVFLGTFCNGQRTM